MTQSGLVQFHCKRRWLFVNALRVGGLLAIAAGGCQPPLPDVLVDAGGSTIRLSAIANILTDTTLTEAQKRQQLADLGITDDQLIDALILGGSDLSSGG